MRFESTAKECTDQNTLSAEGQTVTVVCVFGDQATHKVSYAGKDPSYQDFTLEGMVDPELGEWKVYANGVESNDYTRNGKTVTIPTPLNDGVTVVLVFIPF